MVSDSASAFMSISSTCVIGSGSTVTTTVTGEVERQSSLMPLEPPSPVLAKSFSPSCPNVYAVIVYVTVESEAPKFVNRLVP